MPWCPIKRLDLTMCIHTTSIILIQIASLLIVFQNFCNFVHWQSLAFYCQLKYLMQLMCSNRQCLVVCLEKVSLMFWSCLCMSLRSQRNKQHKTRDKLNCNSSKDDAKDINFCHNKNCGRKCETMSDVLDCCLCFYKFFNTLFGIIVIMFATQWFYYL